MEGQNKYCRGNTYGMIEVDSICQDGAVLEFEDTEKNRILGMDMLAAHLVEKAIWERNCHQRDLLYQDIINLYQTADKILMNQMNHLLGRAFVLLLKSSTIEDANEKIGSMLMQALSLILPKVGRAPVGFSLTKCKRELSVHKSNLHLKKFGHRDTRIEMSHCFLRLGNLEKAESGFRLALKCNPNSTHALIGLAVVRLTSCQSPLNINLCEQLSKELTLDKIGSGSLNEISHKYFEAKKYDKAIKCTNIVLQKSKNVDEVIKSLIISGRIHVKKSEYYQAFEQFYSAIHLSPFIVGYSHYGLGKMYVMNCAFDKAEYCFQIFLEQNPNCIKAKKLLSSLYTRSGDEKKHKKAQKYYEEIVKNDQKDLEAWAGLCMFSKNNNPLLERLYNTVLDLMSEIDVSKLKIEVCISIALVHTQFNKYAECCSLLEESKKALLIEVSKTSINCLYYKFLNNLICSRLGESYLNLRQLQKAEEIFKEMNQLEPTDIGAIINLANVAVLRERYDEAREYAKKSLQINPKCSITLKLIKWLNKENEEDVSELNVDSLTMDALKSLIELTEIAMFCMSNPSADKDKEFNSLALVLLEQLLNLDPQTFWDNDRLSTLLSNNCKSISKFKYLFGISEKSKQLCTSWLFYVDICVKKRRTAMSIKILETCLNLFFIQDNFMAYRILGYEYSLIKNYSGGKKLLLKALMASPGNVFIINNLAFVLQQSGCEALKNNKFSVKEVHKAFENIKLAKKYFAFLLTQENVIVHGAALEGFLSCQVKIFTMPSFVKSARKMEIILKASERQTTANPNST